MAFTIDGRSFDPARTDQHVTAGTTEDWTVRNNGPLAHPFHLHAWPFTVLATSDAAPVSGVPQDVVLVPPWAGPASGSRSPTRPAAPSTTATSSTTKTSA